MPMYLAIFLVRYHTQVTIFEVNYYPIQHINFLQYKIHCYIYGRFVSLNSIILIMFLISTFISEIIV